MRDTYAQYVSSGRTSPKSVRTTGMSSNTDTSVIAPFPMAILTTLVGGFDIEK
jgi:hypothetical protein